MKEKILNIILFPIRFMAAITFLAIITPFLKLTEEDWKKAKGDNVIDDYEYKKSKLIEYWKSTEMEIDENGNMSYNGLDFGNIDKVDIIENYKALIEKREK